MRPGFYLIFFFISFQLSAQVKELGSKFHFADSLLPDENEWKAFLKNSKQDDDRLSFSNEDASRFYAVIVRRDTKSARALVDQEFMVNGSRELQQRVNAKDSVTFFAFPWFTLIENGLTFQACPAFSTTSFKAPDLKTAIEYFAFHDLVTRGYFARQQNLWEANEFTEKTTGGDLALEGRAPIVTASYLRDFYKSQKKAVGVVTQVIPELKRLAPNKHASVDARAAIHLISNDDFSKSLIPFAYLDNKGVAFIGVLYVAEKEKKRAVYLWSNKTPFEHVGRLNDQLLQVIASFPTSRWNPTDDVDRRRYIFNHDFWTTEVESKLANGKFKYLTLIGDEYIR